MARGNRIALVFRGDDATRKVTSVDGSRLAPIADALASVGLAAEPAVFGEEWVDEIREQLLGVAGALIWVDPVTGSEDRGVLDALLREISVAGVFVSAHPDVILRMGTKEVLYTTRELSWATDTYLYNTPKELSEGLIRLLGSGQARVLKQYRGNGGIGVWKIELARPGVPVTVQSNVLVQSARARDENVEESTLGAFLERSQKYFGYAGGEGRLVDQPYLPRIAEGLIRCYLVADEVVGFCRQYPEGLSPDDLAASVREPPPPNRVFGLPAAKTMFGPDEPSLARLRNSVEWEWLPGLQRLTGVEPASLPVLWDADFVLGPPDDTGADTYVLTEINVSAVAPFPKRAVATLAHAVARRVRPPAGE
jgi:hypothetical protein